MRVRETKTRSTLEHLRPIGNAIKAGRKNPAVRTLAGLILNRAHVPERDDAREIEAIFAWVQNTVPFRRDPVDTELLQHMPFQLKSLEMGAQGADCDDLVILLGSLLESVGHPVKLVVTRLEEGRPFGHIYLVAYVRDSHHWIPLDATNKGERSGWESPNYVERRVESLGEHVRDYVESRFNRILSRGEEALRDTRRALEERGSLSDSAPRPRSGAWPYLAASAAVAYLLFTKRK